LTFDKRSNAVIVRLVTLCVLMVVGVGELRAAEPLEEMLSATFRITGKEPSGTCFLVQVNESPTKTVLVTAAHVLEQIGNEAEWIARMDKGDGTIGREVIKLPLRDGDKPRWKRHPELDIAAMNIELPQRLAGEPLALDQIADEQAVSDKKVTVGDEAWIPCYPAKLEANNAGWPVLRRGSIASHPLLPVKSAKTVLLDYTAFGGDSGAPVVVVHDDRPLVIGMVLGMHRQTDRVVSPFEERTTHTPLGLSIVVQASYVSETIALLKE
jgi:hypothetical protein